MIMTNGNKHKIPELDLRRMWCGPGRIAIIHSRRAHQRTSELGNRAGGGPRRTVEEGVRGGGSRGHKWRITTKEWRTNRPFN